jgi:hypothetical protein
LEKGAQFLGEMRVRAVWMKVLVRLFARIERSGEPHAFVAVYIVIAGYDKQTVFRQVYCIQQVVEELLREVVFLRFACVCKCRRWRISGRGIAHAGGIQQRI